MSPFEASAAPLLEMRGIVKTFPGVRAYDPKPGAFTTHRGGDIKLFGAIVADAPSESAHAPGTVVSIDKRGMAITCGSGAVMISYAQPSGRTRIDPDEWMRGRERATAILVHGDVRASVPRRWVPMER